MKIEKIIDEAYELYMPQDRYEITELTQFVEEYHLNKIKKLDYGMVTLEIGTKFGGTFYIWNSLFGSEDDINISIDMSDGGIHGGISDEKMNARDLWFNERFSNCEFIRGDSHSLVTYVGFMFTLNRLGVNNTKNLIEDGFFDLEPCIDFLFIDGDHTYKGVKQDFEMYSPFVKKGGLIGFHDINDSQRHRDRNVYVSKFWNEIKHDARFDAIEFNSNLDWAGIGVLVKKGE